MRRMGFALALVLGSGVALAAGEQPGVPWYDAYNQAIREIKSCGPRLEPTACKDWDTAEARLIAARLRGPAQGPRVLFPGDVYREFVPDYFLGVIYLNTGKFRDAETMFRSVTNKKLAPSSPRQARGGDLLVPTLEQAVQNERSATYGRATSDARARLAEKDITGARNALKDAVGTGLNAAAVTALEKEIEAAASSPGPTPIGLPPVGGGVDLGRGVTPGADPYAEAPIRGRSPEPAAGRETGPRRGAPPDPSRPTAPGGDNTRGRPDPGGRRSPDAAEQARVDQQFADGLRAFLSGNYSGAARMLEEASASPLASPRAKIYLACANAARVLTGQAGAPGLALARSQYNSADPQRYLLDEDRRLISPRILERLR